jgi:hypothetical protein
MCQDLAPVDSYQETYDAGYILTFCFSKIMFNIVLIYV